MTRLTAGAFVLALVAAACGGSKPPQPPENQPPSASEATPPGSGAHASDAPPASASATQGDAGSTAADATSANAVSAAPSAGASASASASAPAEPVDECLPIGVDFEKRARPKLKDCYRDGKKKDPNLQGSVRITVAIDYAGKIKSTRITEKTLPDPVAQCMLKVVKETPMPEAKKCPEKNITIPITFPTPH